MKSAGQILGHRSQREVHERKLLSITRVRDRPFKHLVRRLLGREESRIANSPLQVGAQTCTQLFAFGESRVNLPSDKHRERFSATGC